MTEILMAAAREALKLRFGFESWRPGQAEILEAILADENILAVMPTGSGKSLCYQLPAIVRPGLTIVVSPLIALMRDQVQQLNARGIAAAALHSGNSGADNAALGAGLKGRRFRLVYVAPERIVRPDMQDLLRQAGANMMAIDEAHCVSQWGHDFRPEYLGLRQAADALGIRQLVAVTATADPPTRAEIINKLFREKPSVFVRSFDRPNLRLAMQRKINGMRQLDAMLARHKRESGIIYCGSRRGVEKLAEALASAGHAALPYHAGMEPAMRSAHQDAFLKSEDMIIVATIAFGMGIDKPNVRFVCHADLPQSIESYYQEIGRAGRDGLPADTLTLYGEADIQFRERQIHESEAPAERKRLELRRLSALVALCETPRCRRQTLLAAFGETIEPCGNCDICEGRWRMFDGAVIAQKAMSAILRTSGRFFPGHLTNLLIGRATDAVIRHSHHLLPTFGVGKEFEAVQWRSVFRQLQAANLIEQDLEDHERWVLTEAGRAVLAGKAPLALRSDKPAASQRDLTRGLAAIDAASEDERPKGTQTRSQTRVSAGGMPSHDGRPLDARALRLFAALKSKRLEIAKAVQKPAYVVFTDRSLIEMAVRRPKTQGDFARIYGVDKVKTSAYAPAFLAIIAAEEERN